MVKHILLPALALGMLVFAVVSVVKALPSPRVTLPPEPPPSTTFDRPVAAAGLVEASSENVAVGTPVPGVVKAVHARPGDRVKAGDPLFSIDDRELRAELEVAGAAVAAAQARLARLEAMPRREEIPSAEARLREGEADLGDATLQLARMEQVHDLRAIREEDLSRRRFAVDAARARRDRAQSDLALLEAGAWSEDLEVARAEIRRAQAEARRVETEIERRIVRASLDGEVLQVKVRAGEYAASAALETPLMLLGAVEPLHVRADVDEADAWRVRPGAPATASVRGNASLRVPLEFVRFEPFVIPKRSLTGSVGERVDTRVLQVIYRLVTGGPPLFAGQQVDVFIEGAEPHADSGAHGKGEVR